MCPAAITGTSRYTTVGATTLPRPLLRRFRAAEDIGPYRRLPGNHPAPQKSAGIVRYRRFCLSKKPGSPSGRAVTEGD